MIVVHLTIPAADGTLVTTVLHVPDKTGDEGFDILDRFIARFPDEAALGLARRSR